MNATSKAQILRSFARIGTVADCRTGRWRGVSVNIERIGRMERYLLSHADDIDIAVIDVQPRDRHLLLMVKDPTEKEVANSKFLCGHDERHYFVAAIPEAAAATTVESAKQALKPREIVQLEERLGIKSSDIHSRRRRLGNGVKIYRQGEFMFVPAPDFEPPQPLGILHDEIMTRTSLNGDRRHSGNPHIAKELYREGGGRVYVHRHYPAGLTELERLQLFQNDREARTWRWDMRMRDPLVHVRGTVRHPEHATIHLGRVWHRVYLNTETQAIAMRHVAFID